MALVLGCDLPDDLFYDVENNIWYTENGDGTLTVGMTAVAMGMAGKLVAVTPKKVGRKVKLGKSCATIESGKWVGPAKLATGGEILEINEALVASPEIANVDPYANGWLVKVQPEDWDGVKPQLITGDAIAAAFEAKMRADEFIGCDAAAA
ncbi:MAG: glycine cleavage system protein H [Rhodospirillaceae bacterium]|jgi:glycine cleavage system H protein|nr:glycine cleavage system protein H [Rhodospirillaceae bacterium]MBT4042974.1 glycine cleavage system protein H [Rhodospirillaceae bacterium]MBT4691052.1 glycine cleavage system protein H [Rhodospirillaceae bacterium]MBT5079459.1 glycine cleavage system protein H [Rhodospirillaceae bacterium]MBT5526896.1 glycine cleavage system protein H [Rhodospirillaceae bacterium]